jgi:hypothetical protein
VSLEGEEPKKTPDFARTLAIASALADHRWAEPYVSEMWREEAKRELDDMIEQRETAADGNDDSSQGGSSEYEDEGDGREVKKDETASDYEDGESSSPAEERPMWPKGVVGLI